MKTRTRIGLSVTVALLAIGFSAFKTMPDKEVSKDTSKPVVATTYYGYVDGSGNNKWSTTVPSGDCDTDNSSHKTACEITSTTAQATVLATTNAFPANYSIVSGANNIYR